MGDCHGASDGIFIENEKNCCDLCSCIPLSPDDEEEEKVEENAV
jgi:hypothetical protein